MSFVAAAVGGTAAIGIGASIYGGMQQAGAAEDASNAQGDAIRQSMATQQRAGFEALAYLDPYRQMGLNAATTLQSMLYSPQQRQDQFTQTRIQLEGQLARVKALAPGTHAQYEQTHPYLTGDYASERWLQGYAQAVGENQQQQATIQNQLDTLNKQEQAFQANPQGPQAQASPWYQFQADLLNRSMDRREAATGQTGSGAPLEERRQGLLQLGAQETENQYNRIAHLYDVGANATNVGAGIITGTAQNIANNQVQLGNAQANGILGVAGANADMLTNISNSVTGAAAMGLQQKQWQMFAAGLNARNNPTAARDPVFDSVDSGSGSYNYLRPVS